MPTNEDARKRVLNNLADWINTLRSANDELSGERNPADPVDLVRRIREAHSNIQELLNEAERLEVDDVVVKRLRAAHPARPAT